jgi:predicted enzyme related to lactoylglutathione lyase
MIDHINALVLPVRDVKACAVFYRDRVGFNLDQLDDEEGYLTIGGGIVLAIKSIDLVAKQISQERIRPQEKEGIKRTHFVVFVNNVDDEYRELTKKGVRFVKAPTTQPDGWRTAHFEDPENNLWEISQRPKKNT